MHVCLRARRTLAERVRVIMAMLTFIGATRPDPTRPGFYVNTFNIFSFVSIEGVSRNLELPKYTESQLKCMALEVMSMHL